jgi:hypothetical protein
LGSMDRAAETYQRILTSLTDVGLRRFVEPVEHVLEVERLRQRYRPDGDVRFLLLAESHVRVGPDYFRKKGAGFLYEARYYTPWWRDLLLPAFGKIQSTTAHTREQWLSRLKQEGFWLLDVSLLSLSGYQKVDREWPRRPLDEFREQIISDSWHGHVKQTFNDIMAQSKPPVVCAFRNVAFVLDGNLPEEPTLLAFNSQQNARVYSSPDYGHGTARFQEAAKRACIAGCLL